MQHGHLRDVLAQHRVGRADAGDPWPEPGGSAARKCRAFCLPPARHHSVFVLKTSKIGSAVAATSSRHRPHAAVVRHFHTIGLQQAPAIGPQSTCRPTRPTAGSLAPVLANRRRLSSCVLGRTTASCSDASFANRISESQTYAADRDRDRRAWEPSGRFLRRRLGDQGFGSPSTDIHVGRAAISVRSSA